MERVVREVRSALQRRNKESRLAQKGAQQAPRNELKGPITALLISCEMALQIPELQSAAEAKMRAVYDLPQQIRTKLGSSGLECCLNFYWPLACAIFCVVEQFCAK
jgi:hypothetical protein